MKELVEITAAAVLACWGKTVALAHSLGEAPADLWQLISFLPLLLVGMIKARGSSAGDESERVESHDRALDSPVHNQNTPPPPSEPALPAECTLLAPRQEVPSAEREEYTPAPAAECTLLAPREGSPHAEREEYAPALAAPHVAAHRRRMIRGL